MNETSSSLNLPASTTKERIHASVIKTANLSRVSSDSEDTLLYAGQTVSHKSDVLVKLCITSQDDDNISLTITVNCEKIVIGSMLIKDIKLALLSL